jgi:Ni/Fe-hydrogenase subunit HybB-like protein
MSSKYFGRELELPILRDMGRVLVVVLAIYGILRFEDLLHRGVLHLAFVPGYEQGFFLLEIFLSVLIPLALLMFPKVRNSAQGLYLVAVLTLLGFVTNRLNIAITGVENAVGARYTPKWTEVVITAMFVALGFAIFGFVARFLPIFPEEKAHLPAIRKVTGVRAEVAVPVHAGD